MLDIGYYCWVLGIVVGLLSDVGDYCWVLISVGITVDLAADQMITFFVYKRIIGLSLPAIGRQK